MNKLITWDHECLGFSTQRSSRRVSWDDITVRERKVKTPNAQTKSPRHVSTTQDKKKNPWPIVEPLLLPKPEAEESSGSEQAPPGPSKRRLRQTVHSHWQDPLPHPQLLYRWEPTPRRVRTVGDVFKVTLIFRDVDKMKPLTYWTEQRFPRLCQESSFIIYFILRTTLLTQGDFPYLLR